MPRLWDETIEAHRVAVRDATLDAAAALVAEHGLLGVTMSRVAERTGIGRATLYKYFPDVESILAAWHERQIAEHLARLVEVRDRTAPGHRLVAVLESYVHLSRHPHPLPGGELAAALHRNHHRARRMLVELVGDLLAAGVDTGDIRSDVPTDELARYCLHALGAADGAASEAAIHRLVTVTVSGLRPAP